MPTVTSDYVSGHSYSDVLAGFEIRRTFRVTDLTETPDRQLIEAVTTPGIPLLNTVYPGTTGILAVRRDVAPDGPNAARIVVTYSAQTNVSSYNQPIPVGNDGEDVKQISSGVREVSTTKALGEGGTPDMILNPPSSRDGWDGPYLSEATVFVPTGELVFERPETSVSAARARGLIGRVNSLALGGGLYAAKTLLFTHLDSRSTDGGRRWRCTYHFRYDSAGWQHKDRYRGPDGKVPIDATEQTWDVLLSADFGTLGLDFTDSQDPI